MLFSTFSTPQSLSAGSRRVQRGRNIQAGKSFWDLGFMFSLHSGIWWLVWRLKPGNIPQIACQLPLMEFSKMDSWVQITQPKLQIWTRFGKEHCNTHMHMHMHIHISVHIHIVQVRASIMTKFETETEYFYDSLQGFCIRLNYGYLINGVMSVHEVHGLDKFIH